MARNTARTGKLKRSKARKEPTGDAAATREASVGELLAALEGAADSKAPTAEQAHAVAMLDPGTLGLEGYEDDDSQDLPPAPAPAPAPAPREDGVELSDTLPMAPEDDLSRVRGQASPRLMSVVESLLFASERPLTVRDIRRVLKEPTVRQVQLALKQLAADTATRGVVLSQVAGGFRLRTNPANAQWVQRMLSGKPARLSRSQLEALAVIAYRQPITKAEVDHVRGVDCGAVLRVLLERDLARIVGRKEEPGRPHLYGTTVEFLEFFNLRSLRDMPDLHEFRELTDESRAEVRAELGEDADEIEAEVLGQEVLRFEGGAVTASSGASDEAEAAANDDAGDRGASGTEGPPEDSAETVGDDAEATSGSAATGSAATERAQDGSVEAASGSVETDGAQESPAETTTDDAEATADDAEATADDATSVTEGEPPAGHEGREDASVPRAEPVDGAGSAVLDEGDERDGAEPAAEPGEQR